ncbi:conserved hypothetical protein [Ricinus communis]|uniref:DDE Tnp4 domain-containing protein n=1 Tax=Ricinus communis TaxID=3988 RepID=B9SPW7_RICCO|nr:conserved hypothetical protein [Ricinus communis]
MGKETALGWNPTKGTIDVSDEWWKEKIQLLGEYAYAPSNGELPSNIDVEEYANKLVEEENTNLDDEFYETIHDIRRKILLGRCWTSTVEGYLEPYRKTINHLPDFDRWWSAKEALKTLNRWCSSLGCCIGRRTFGFWKAPSYPFERQRVIMVATMAVHNCIPKQEGIR